MYKHILTLPQWAGLCILPLVLACSGPSGSRPLESHAPIADPNPQTAAPIAEYVVSSFEDSKGNLWFGTMEKGVARYDGHSLSYLSVADGLSGNTVTSIQEDKDGNMWFGTHTGLSRYNGITFTNFTRKDGLIDDRVSHLRIDRTGRMWIGTWNGVCRYDGVSFSDFPVPKPALDLLPYQNTMNWVTEIKEDRQGNIWLGWDGYGACKYDGTSFTFFTQKNGLASNNVQAIEEDNQGHIWFGCRVRENDNPDPNGRKGPGGLTRFDGKTFLSFPDIEGLAKNDIYTLYTDHQGNLWIGATRVGLYRYDGASFRKYQGTNRMDLTYSFGVQSLLEDRRGILWIGFSGGLFRLDGNSIVHVTAAGPWN